MNRIILLVITSMILAFPSFGKEEFITLKIKNPGLLDKKYKSGKSQKSGAIGGIELTAPLIDRVVNRIKDIYQKVGADQSGEILNSGYELGVLNNPSFFWQLPFGEIKVSARRQVDPDLFHATRYIVTDELIISVDAHKLLTNLKNDDIIEISDQFLGLYAGLEFRRVYRFSHFAENFVEGLTTNFEYLFFPFFYLRSKMLLELSEYQYLERIDQLSAEVGGALNYQMPVYAGISVNAQAAFMYGYQNLTKVTMQVVGKEDQRVGDILSKINVSYEREKKLSTEFSAQLQLEFLKILKLTLLQYDYEYSDTSSKKIDLSFKESDISGSTDENVLGELDKLFLGASFDESFFTPYKVQEEIRIKQNLGSKYAVLFWKGTNEKETERVQTYKDGKLKTYYKHTFQKTIFSQTLWQMILPKLFLEIFNVGAINQYRELDQRIFHMEYRSEEDLLKDNQLLEFEDEEKISASFSIKYFAKTFKLAPQRKVKMTGLLRSYAYIDSKILSWIDHNDLIPPMDLYLKTAITQNGIINFNHKSAEQVKKDILWICNNESKIKSTSYFSVTQINDEMKTCVTFLESAYKVYYTKVQDADYQSIPIQDFKILLEQFSKYFSNKGDIERIFGKENVFIFGKFSSKTKEGKSFVHNFKHGELKSLGVINDNSINRSKDEIQKASEEDAQQDE